MCFMPKQHQLFQRNIWGILYLLCLMLFFTWHNCRQHAEKAKVSMESIQGLCKVARSTRRWTIQTCCLVTQLKGTPSPAKESIQWLCRTEWCTKRRTIQTLLLLSHSLIRSSWLPEKQFQGSSIVFRIATSWPVSLPLLSENPVK